jgi:fibronectin-binding autotransporter adhesin
MKIRKNEARRRISPLILAVSAAYGCWNRNASAQYSWNTATGDWSSAGSWTPSGPPTNGATVNIINADATGRTVFYDYPASSTLTLSNLTINDTGGGTNTLNWSTSYTLQSLEESIGDSNESNVSGRGAVIQDGGTNAVTNNLYIGSYNDDTGVYTLSGGELTITSSSGTENVGNGGNATFIQSGGVNDISGGGSFYMANNGGSSAYSLSSTGTLTVSGSEFIGNGGNATFVQSGGINNMVAFGATEEYVGYSSSGTYIQTAGLNDMANFAASLIIGYGAGVTGLYSLSGTGLLDNANLESINGSGTFIQSGGTNSIAASIFEVDGLYSLSGGSLMVIQGGQDNVDGRFIQNGGSHQVGDGSTTTNLSIGTNGLYSLSGTGTLTVEEGQESVASTAMFNQSGGTNTISQALDLTGTYTLSNNGQLTAGETPTGPYNDGEYINGTFNQTGGANSIVSGQSLHLGQSGSKGTYLLSAGSLFIDGDQLVGDGGTGVFSLSGTGSLSVLGQEYIGNGGAGTFIQSGGTNAPGRALNSEYVGYSSSGTYIQSGGLNDMSDTAINLILGYNAGVIGIYSLSGTGVLINSNLESINASGTFIQSGGSNTIDDSMFEVYGLYSLSGGSLMVIQGGGDSVVGTFIQSGGSHQVGDDEGDTNLSIGSGDGGIYSLSGTGTLTIVEGQESVGSTATFSQSGGTNTISEALDLNGTYTLSDGNLTAGEPPTGPFNDGEYIDGTFSQSGGTNSIVSSQSLYLADQSGSHGTYLLSAGTLSVAGSMYVGGSSTAAEGIGSLSVSGSGSLTVDGTLQVWNSTGTQVTITGGTVTAGNTVNLATITQTGGTSSLGALSGTGSISVGNSSGALAAMTVTALAQNSVTVNSTGTLKMIGGASNNTINKLTINGSGKLDVTNGHFFIDYAGGTDPISTIRGYLAFGYARGAWNGPGIDSSIAALPANSHYGIGYADYADGIFIPGLSSGQIEVKYTLYGDANLDGVVNGSDFTILAGSLGKSVTAWDKGDFNYDGVVNATDFTLLIGNLGKSATGADVAISAADYAAIDAFAAANGLMADVPEPSALAIIAIASAGLCHRRRRG